MLYVLYVLFEAFRFNTFILSETINHLLCVYHTRYIAQHAIHQNFKVKADQGKPITKKTLLKSLCKFILSLLTMSQQSLNKYGVSSPDGEEHLLKLETLCALLNTDCYYGLTWKDSKHLLRKDGMNKYTRPDSGRRNTSLFKNLFKTKSKQYWSKRDWNRVFNTHLDDKYMVIRDGERCYVKRRELVKGDLAYLFKTQIVPADMRIITYEGELIVDNRVITGNPAEFKSNSPTSTDFLLTQNIIFASTTILSGSCEAIVLKTGDETVFAELSQFATKVKLLPRPQCSSDSSTSSELSLNMDTLSLPSSLSLASDSGVSRVMSCSL